MIVPIWPFKKTQQFALGVISSFRNHTKQDSNPTFFITCVSSLMNYIMNL